MAALRNARTRAQGHGEFTTVEAMVTQYAHIERCDPETDLVVVEHEGEVVGYARTTWDDSDDGTRHHWLIVEADDRHPGLDAQVLEWCATRATEIARSMATTTDRPQRLVTEALLGTSRAELLERSGFTPIRYGAIMIRPHLRDIPDRPLPEGVEIRSVEESHLRAIWEADVEAFRDHWNFVEPTEEDWAMFRDDACTGGLELWQVAWAGDAVVGQVRTYENDGEAEMWGVRRAWTEHISTARAWRQRGIAGAVISASLCQLAELGFDQAALGVDTQNPNGAGALYASLGYETVANDAVFSRLVS